MESRDSNQYPWDKHERPDSHMVVRAVGGATLAMMTSKEAGVLLGVNSATVGLYVRSGLLSGRKIGRSWRIDRRSVERLLQLGTEAIKAELPPVPTETRVSSYSSTPAYSTPDIDRMMVMIRHCEQLQAQSAHTDGQ